MITFCCKNCNQKISVAETLAGRKGKCPKCKQLLIVPESNTPHQVTNQISPHNESLPEAVAEGKKLISFKCLMCDSDIQAPKSSIGQVMECPECGCYVEPPQEKPKANTPSLETEDWHKNQSVGNADREDHVFAAVGISMETHSKRTKADESEQIGTRKLPVFIDVFLYPISAPGLTMLGIFIFVPVILDLISRFLMLAGPIGLIIGLPLNMIFGLVGLVIWGYFFWYFGLCVHESACGYVRAPETLAGGGGASIGDIAIQTIRIIGCEVVCLAPAIIYVILHYNTYAKGGALNDTNLRLLLAVGAFFLPMVLLSTIMFDSISGLNPIIIIGSIFSVFFKYILIVLAFYFTILISIAVAVNLPKEAGIVGVYLFKAVEIYMLLVMAHVLGWFYYRNEKKLNWEV